MSERDLSPRFPDFKSSALTTRLIPSSSSRKHAFQSKTHLSFSNDKDARLARTCCRIRGSLFKLSKRHSAWIAPQSLKSSFELKINTLRSGKHTQLIKEIMQLLLSTIKWSLSRADVVKISRVCDKRKISLKILKFWRFSNVTIKKDRWHCPKRNQTWTAEFC